MERCDASGGPWIAVNTNPHRERMVLENLQRQGLAACCPMMRDRLIVLLNVMNRGLRIKLSGDMVAPAYGSG
jgi:hypothetical protein